jgi:hypothetical protein
VVLSTVVPTSFMGVDSFYKMRYKFIAGNLTILLWETLSAGRGNILPFDWVKSHVPCCL